MVATDSNKLAQRIKQRGKEFFSNKRILFLLIMLLLSLIMISPFQRDGVSIRSVDKDSYAADYITVEKVRPLSRERITQLDAQKIHSSQEYYNYLRQLPPNSTVRVQTSKDVYRLILNENKDLGISISDTPFSNIQKGLDLEGGTRVLLRPKQLTSEDTLSDAADSLRIRLSTFGLSNVVVRTVTTPNQYLVVELAGTTKEEVKQLLLQQGKFEATIGNATVITGKDIERVGKSAQEVNARGCQPSGDGYSCGYDFSLRISRTAAERFAEATRNLAIAGDQLSEPINLYLDGEMLNNLSIAADLKGKASTQVSISVSGSGSSQREAQEDARAEMRQLQTILQSGSLPIELEIAEAETISPVLGKQFTSNALQVGILSILTVAAVVFLVYRKIKIAIPILITMTSEIIILLGVAAAIQWQLDLAAIAGIIIAAGTGVDDQIVITTEILKGERAIYNWKEKMKRAFFIIMGSYFATVVATIPLAWAGAGLLKGFAFATIVGVTIGVFIARPAFAAMLEFLMKD